LLQRHNEFEFREKRIFLRSEHSASGSLAGKSAKCVVFDELDKFEFTASGESSAEEVYSVVTKSTGRFGTDGIIVSISSPVSTDGLFWKLVEKGKKNPNLGMLVVHKPTWEMVDLTIKPEYAFDSEYMTAEREKDYDKFMRDYGAQPVGRLVPFFPDIDPIKACERNVRSPVVWENHRPHLADWYKPIKGKQYVIAGDPALRRDAFGLAMGHVEKDTIVVDFTMKFEKVPPAREINASHVRSFIEEIIDRGFKVSLFVTDVKTFPELFQSLEKRGVKIEQSFVKKETYDYLKERINLGEIFWPRDPDLFDELIHLEIVSQRKVDHPKFGSKDIADALANMAFYVKDVQRQKPVWRIISKW
ncbi:hypothetical protein DRO54_11045, partial [Candidatus Bathyarchaeota archaeon]